MQTEWKFPAMECHLEEPNLFVVRIVGSGFMEEEAIRGVESVVRSLAAERKSIYWMVDLSGFTGFSAGCRNAIRDFDTVKINAFVGFCGSTTVRTALTLVMRTRRLLGRKSIYMEFCADEESARALISRHRSKRFAIGAAT